MVLRALCQCIPNQFQGVQKFRPARHLSASTNVLTGVEKKTSAIPPAAFNEIRVATGVGYQDYALRPRRARLSLHKRPSWRLFTRATTLDHTNETVIPHARRISKSELRNGSTQTTNIHHPRLSFSRTPRAILSTRFPRAGSLSSSLPKALPPSATPPPPGAPIYFPRRCRTASAPTALMNLIGNQYFNRPAPATSIKCSPLPQFVGKTVYLHWLRRRSAKCTAIPSPAPRLSGDAAGGILAEPSSAPSSLAAASANTATKKWVLPTWPRLLTQIPCAALVASLRRPHPAGYSGDSWARLLFFVCRGACLLRRARLQQPAIDSRRNREFSPFPSMPLRPVRPRKNRPSVQ